MQDGIRFPMNLNNPAAACYVLTQKPGKLKAKDLREGIPFYVWLMILRTTKDHISLFPRNYFIGG